MDLGIDFRNLVREDNGSGYKSTSANEKIVDEMGSLRTRELAYELSTKRVWVVGPGVDRIDPGSTGSGLVWVTSARTSHAGLAGMRPVCAAGLLCWLGHGAPALCWSAWCWACRRCWPEEMLVEGKKRREEKERKKERRRKKEKKERRRERLVREREKRGRRKREARDFSG